jgi:dihydroxy-acid dehydratase
MDLPLLIIGVLLIASLVAFFTGLMPYPIGWIILSVAFIGRWLFLRAR